MSDFKAKIHQIRFRLGLSPRPRWGSLHRALLQTPYDLKGLLLMEGTGNNGRGGRGKGGESVGEKREREEKGNLPRLKFRAGYGTAYDPPFLIVWLRLRSIISSKRHSPNIWLATGLILVRISYLLK